MVLLLELFDTSADRLFFVKPISFK